jgi:hypothetical protein
LHRRGRTTGIEEERVITQACEHPEAVTPTFQPAFIGRVPGRAVKDPHPTVDRLGDKPAGNVRRGRRLAEGGAAGDVKDVGQPLGEAVTDNGHHQVQPSSRRVGPGVDIPDVGARIGVHRGGIKVVGRPARARPASQHEKREEAERHAAKFGV